MKYNRPIYMILPFEIHYHTKDAFGKWSSTFLHQGYWSRDERDEELKRLSEYVKSLHLTHIEYWASTNQMELQKQEKERERIGYDHNHVI